MKFLNMRNYSTPVGRFTVSKQGEALKLYVGCNMHFILSVKQLVHALSAFAFIVIDASCPL